MLESRWKEFISRPELVGMELEFQSVGRRVIRGPIMEIMQRGSTTFFYLLWCAHLSNETRAWKVAPCLTNIAFRPAEMSVCGNEARNLILTGPDFIIATIFTEDKLDPALVAGLDLNNLPRKMVAEPGELVAAGGPN